MFVVDAPVEVVFTQLPSVSLGVSFMGADEMPSRRFAASEIEAVGIIGDDDPVPVLDPEQPDTEQFLEEMLIGEGLVKTRMKVLKTRPVKPKTKAGKT